MREPVLRVRDLVKHYPVESGALRRVTGAVKAVDGVSFDLGRGEVLGLVGESGSGKTTLGRCIIRAIEPTSGSVEMVTRGGTTVELIGLPKRELRALRTDINMIFQDPFSSLSPRLTVADIIGEPLTAQGQRARDVGERVREMARMVGLNVAHLNRYPNAFSGGQRQRICIARALVTRPLVIVADEAVSALDVSIQAQVLNLMQDLQEQLNLSYLFIAHDLSVVEHIADRVGVMYVGKMVELAPTASLYSRPRHPYTEALLSAVPRPEPGLDDTEILLKGEVASPASPPPGCAFHPRCHYAQAICRTDLPPLRTVSPGHQAACHFADVLNLKGAISDPAFSTIEGESERAV